MVFNNSSPNSSPIISFIPSLNACSAIFCSARKCCMSPSFLNCAKFSCWMSLSARFSPNSRSHTLLFRFFSICFWFRTLRDFLLDNLQVLARLCQVHTEIVSDDF
uniref:Uncharacterized protein n=1 Tax=uncultured marine virus TaxID=186617 RepID=A0A0F7L3S9_9VIRU|nr:hypothetical protein [uncultured marine virus]